MSAMPIGGLVGNVPAASSGVPSVLIVEEEFPNALHACNLAFRVELASTGLLLDSPMLQAALANNRYIETIDVEVRNHGTTQFSVHAYVVHLEAHSEGDPVTTSIRNWMPLP